MRHGVMDEDVAVVNRRRAGRRRHKEVTVTLGFCEVLPYTITLTARQFALSLNGERENSR